MRQGEPLGWGTYAEDHGEDGLFLEGPHPAVSPLARMIGFTAAPEKPQEPGVARAILTRVARQRLVKRRMTLRQALGMQVPLVVGRKRA